MDLAFLLLVIRGAGDDAIPAFSGIALLSGIGEGTAVVLLPLLVPLGDLVEMDFRFFSLVS